MISDELYVCLILTAPLYAAFTAMLFPVGRGALVVAGAAWLGAASIYLLQVDPAGSTLYLGTWLGDSVEAAHSVRFQFQFDTISAITLGTGGLLIITVNSLTRSTGADIKRASFDAQGESLGPDGAVSLYGLSGEGAPRVLFLVFLSGVSCLATDLTIVVISWLLLDVTMAWRLGSGCSESRTGPFKPLQVSSLILLFALVQVLARYDTAQVGVVLRKSVEDSRVDASSARVTLSVLIAMAIFLRAAMLPGVLWLKRLIADARAVDLFLVPLATLIPAGALLMRLGFVIRAEPQSVIYCAAAAAVAAVLAAGFAVAQSRPAAAVLLVQTALFAQAATMFCSRQPIPAWPLHFIPISAASGFGLTILSVGHAGTGGRKYLLSFAAIVVASCFYGAPFTFDPDWDWQEASRIQVVVRIALGVSQLLLPVAMFRCLGCRRETVSVRTLPLLLSVSLIAGFLGLTMFYFSRQFGQPRVLLNLWPVAGVAIGLLLWGNEASVSKALAPLRPVQQFAGECGYISQLCDWLLATPARLVSRATEAFDRLLMGGSREGAWLAHFRELAGHVTSLRELEPGYAALAALLCLTGLLLVLTGIGS